MIKQMLRRVVLREKANSEAYVAYLRKKGVSVGEDVTIFSPTHTFIDTTCPWLLSIGNHVRITHGVIILTHDYSWSVLKNYSDCTGAIFGAQSPVKIGNNVFIGMNSIITRGVTVGDNVIIGAGSVVTKDCESNSVYAGNPAKKIMGLEDFLKKRRDKQIEEARNIAKLYKVKYGKMPPKEVFREYFMLFMTADEAEAVPDFKSQMATSDGLDASREHMNKHGPTFENYESFLRECMSCENSEINEIPNI